MDLNGDGKHDWQDDYLTQKMIDLIHLIRTQCPVDTSPTMVRLWV